MMKKIIVSGALSALLAIPAMAVEVFNGEVKGQELKVDLYGSIRAFAGAGMGLADNATGGNAGRFLLGVQDNSLFGVRAESGKFKSNIQFGANEPNGIGYDENGQDGAINGFGLREFWGSYDTGLGTILIGKATNVTVDSGYTSNWFNHDNGMMGFGGIYTGHRRIQIQYHIAGLQLGVIEDEGVGYFSSTQLAVPPVNTTDNLNHIKSPLLTAAYELKSGAVDFKVGGSWKRYIGSVAANDIQAWHVMAAVKPKFGNMYVSILLNAGQNAYMYGAQSVRTNTGGYLHNNVSSLLGNDAMIYGGVATFGMKFTDAVSFAVGAGYQMATGGTLQKNGGSGNISSYAVYANVPYKVTNNFTFAPQVAYYNTNIGNMNDSSVLAAARFRYDF